MCFDSAFMLDRTAARCGTIQGHCRGITFVLVPVHFGEQQLRSFLISQLNSTVSATSLFACVVANPGSTMMRAHPPIQWAATVQSTDRRRPTDFYDAHRALACTAIPFQPITVGGEGWSAR